MLTKMSDAEWTLLVDVFRSVCSGRGEKGHDDRKLLETLHLPMVHNISWRALPPEFGKGHSAWKRFWRLSQTGVFEALDHALAETSDTAHLVQMFDSTVVWAHVSAAGAKGGSGARRLRGGIVSHHVV